MRLFRAVIVVKLKVIEMKVLEFDVHENCEEKSSKNTFLVHFHFILCSGVIYAASGSAEYVNFVNQDREFTCFGENPVWVLPNETRLEEGNVKYQIVSVSDNESKLIIKDIVVKDVGKYTCFTKEKQEVFELRTYCEDYKK